MKLKLTLFLSFFSLLFVFTSIYADENEVNIKEWNFHMLTKSSDQDRNVIVSKFYNLNDESKYAFCIEANIDYLPVGSNYTRFKNKNEYIYNIVKAYNSIGLNDDNYFIAAQILIWEDTDGISYTFNGNDYKQYKDDLLNYINPKKPLLKSNTKNEIIESYVGEESFINNDYSEYNIQANGIDIISNDENGLSYIITDPEPEIKTLSFTPKDNDENHSFVFHDENSQDLYYFEGEYETKNPFSLMVKSLIKPSFVSINYSKKDENGKSIKGAEFSLYQLNLTDNDFELVFIQKDKDINLCEALLDNKNNYSNLKIETTERFDRYIQNNVINAKEIGYFSYKLYENESLIKQGIVYVSDDTKQTNNSYNRMNSKLIFKGFSEDLEINSINNIPINSQFYLCESEPKKGYIYSNNPCYYIDTSVENSEIYEFINKNRTYSLRLMKESPEEIYLNGAIFRITYEDDDKQKSILFTTGAFSLDRVNNYKYLIFKHENDINAQIIEFNSDNYTNATLKEGKYYYYQSNSNIINKCLLYENFTYVLNGGFIIDNLPYSSSLKIEELKAPEGYIINDPVYYISPDISYSDITFRNYRINYLDILPKKKKFKFPKTCIER